MLCPGSISRSLLVFSMMTCCTFMSIGQSGFVTLQGRNFKLDGQDFYPQVMNFGLELTTNTIGTQDTSLLYMTPEGTYDRLVTQEFECQDPAECDVQLLAHFAQVKAMGFNAIRAYGGLAPINLRDSAGQRSYKLNIHANTGFYWSYREPLDYPGFTGAMAMKHFGLVRHMLDLCDSMDLKMILLAGGRVGYEPPDPIRPWRYYRTEDAEAYARYLARLGSELQGHPALMAYDLWNEPRWGEDSTHLQTKQTVCEWTTMFYDSLKTHDPEHLITLGGSPLSELNSWDPMVMKLDFYSPHFYPEVELFGNYDVAKAFDAMRAEMYWLGKTCPMPWMLGETAFSADDDTTDHANNPDNVGLLPEAMFHRMPWMQGNEDEQVAYAFESMDAVRANLGSGYSWRDFQSNRNNAIQHNGNFRPALEVNKNWHSLLGYGDGTNPWRVKKAADTLDTYVLPPEEQDLPASPYNYPSWLGFESDSIETYGWVRNTYGEPIADAVIEWGWKYNTRPGQPVWQFPEESVWDRITTFGDGYFQVPKPEYEVAGWWRRPQIGGAILSAHGGMGYQGINDYAAGSIFEIERHLPLAHEIIGPGTLSIGDTVHYRAYNELSVHDQVVSGNVVEGAVADFSARFAVHITGEFHAQHGSEVHIYNEQIWPDCNSPALRSSAHVVEPVAPLQDDHRDAPKWEMTLKFKTGCTDLTIAPNPASTFLHVTCPEAQGSCIISDSQGRECMTWVCVEHLMRIDVSALFSGRYELQYQLGTCTRTKSFIVQH